MPDLAAAEPHEREKGTEAHRAIPGLQAWLQAWPGERGPAEKDRPIDPMCGKNTPA